MPTGNRFSTTNANAPDISFGSEALADIQLADLAMQAQFGNLTNIGTGTGAQSGTTVLTAAQLINGVVFTSLSSAMTLLVPNASSICSSLVNVQTGSTFEFLVVNNGSALTMTVSSTGLNSAGFTAAATTIGAPGAFGKGLPFRGIVTNPNVGSEAVTLVALISAGT